MMLLLMIDAIEIRLRQSVFLPLRRAAAIRHERLRCRVAA